MMAAAPDGARRGVRVLVITVGTRGDVTPGGYGVSKGSGVASWILRFESR
jgi:hypothetical protein